MPASYDMDTLDVPDFFSSKSRSGDPTTEELHAETLQTKVCVRDAAASSAFWILRV